MTPQEVEQLEQDIINRQELIKRYQFLTRQIESLEAAKEIFDFKNWTFCISSSLTLQYVNTTLIHGNMWKSEVETDSMKRIVSDVKQLLITRINEECQILQKEIDELKL